MTKENQHPIPDLLDFVIPSPGIQRQLVLQRAVQDGGWLCPALLKYFPIRAARDFRQGRAKELGCEQHLIAIANPVFEFPNPKRSE